MLQLLGLHLVQLLHEVHLPALLGRPDIGIVDVLDHLLHVRRLRVDAGALEHARQERRAVVGRPARGQAAVAQGDEAGQVLVLGAKPVHHPGSHARLRDPQRAGVHEDRRHLVRRDVRVHRADDRHVVHVLADSRKELAHLGPRLAHRGELEGRAHGDAAVADRPAVHAAPARAWGPRCRCARARPGRRCGSPPWPSRAAAAAWGASGLPDRRPPPGPAAAEKRSAGSSMVARPRAPKPIPTRFRNFRRVRK